MEAGGIFLLSSDRIMPQYGNLPVHNMRFHFFSPLGAMIPTETEPFPFLFPEEVE